MDLASRMELSRLWPDLLERFAEIVPDGLTLVRSADWWSQAKAARHRWIELIPTEVGPDFDALLDESVLDAVRVGWTDLEDGGHRFEMEDVVLEIAARSSGLRFSFDQPWPADVPAPVETSEMFQNLAREGLRLGGLPIVLAKEQQLGHEFVVDSVRERVELKPSRCSTAQLEALRFVASHDDPDLWVSTDTTESHEIIGTVRMIDDTVVLELNQILLRS